VPVGRCAPLEALWPGAYMMSLTVRGADCGVAHDSSLAVC
jgi:hypothetical protein